VTVMLAVSEKEPEVAVIEPVSALTAVNTTSDAGVEGIDPINVGVRLQLNKAPDIVFP